MEVGSSSIAFLDVTIALCDSNDFETSVFRKPTNTNLLLNFTSYAPSSYKNSIITCFINRAFSICSTWKAFNSEIGKLRHIFKCNSYPENLFNGKVRSFLQKVHSNKSKELADKEDVTHTIVLPYFARASLHFKQNLKKFNKQFNKNIRVVFTTLKVASYFSLKSKCPKPLHSCVVYQFTCAENQHITYVGKTKRHLLTRVKEHKGVNSKSAIFDHIASCNCKVSYDNFRILFHAKETYSLSIAEALMIKDRRPILNRTLANNGASLYLKL